jgi:hypothetical protein
LELGFWNLAAEAAKIIEKIKHFGETTRQTFLVMVYYEEAE